MYFSPLFMAASEYTTFGPDSVDMYGNIYYFYAIIRSVKNDVILSNILCIPNLTTDHGRDDRKYT